MSRKADVIALQHHTDLVPVVADDVLVTASIGPAGEAIALWSTAEVEAALHGRTIANGGSSFPDPRPARPVAARVTIHRPGSAVEAIEIAELDIAHPHIQPLPDGRVLLVGARCRWRPEGPDRNAVVYDADGDRVARGTLGDGIKHVLTTPSGAIWVGYFDEGVYGNYGWGRNGAPAPIGSPGIIRFGINLQPDWRFPIGGTPEAPDDVYAMNVDGETAWACYYRDFPIVRIDNSRVTHWSNQQRSNHSLLVGDDECALLSGHKQLTAVTGRLDSGSFSPRRTSQIVVPKSPDRGRPRLVCRGAELHVIVDRQWLKIDLDDLR